MVLAACGALTIIDTSKRGFNSNHMGGSRYFPDIFCHRAREFTRHIPQYPWWNIVCWHNILHRQLKGGNIVTTFTVLVKNVKNIPSCHMFHHEFGWHPQKMWTNWLHKHLFKHIKPYITIIFTETNYINIPPSHLTCWIWPQWVAKLPGPLQVFVMAPLWQRLLYGPAKRGKFPRLGVV